MNSDNTGPNRRMFIGMGIAAGTAALAPTEAFAARGKEREKTVEEEVSPPEDLMREHAALERIMLIYDKATDDLAGGGKFPVTVLAGAAGIVRSFIEDYHEKLEEDYLFPRFKKANSLVDLVTTLNDQHKAGRILTNRITNAAKEEAPPEDTQRLKALAEDLRAFNRMYRPHAAREGTVLFPALRTVVTPGEFDDMGEEFEDKERELFGKEGFFGVVDQIAQLERKVGLYELERFTPKT